MKYTLNRIAAVLAAAVIVSAVLATGVAQSDYASTLGLQNAPSSPSAPRRTETPAAAPAPAAASDVKTFKELEAQASGDYQKAYYAKAIPEFTRLIELSANEPNPKLTAARMLCKRGDCYLYTGDPARALADYDKVFELDKQAGSMGFGYAIALPFTNRKLAAEKKAATAQGNPQAPSPAAARAAAYAKDAEEAYSRFLRDYEPGMGKLQPLTSLNFAITSIWNAIEIDPTNADYRAKAGLYNMKKEEAKAAEAAADTSDDPHKRGLAQYRKGDYNSAIETLTQAIAQKPELAAAYKDRARAYFKKGDYDRAIADNTKAIALDPQYAAAYGNRADAYFHKRDYDRAIADYDKAIKLEPFDRAADEGRRIAIARKASANISPAAAAAFKRGNEAFDKKRYDEAIEEYGKAIEENNGYVAAYVNRSRAYFHIEHLHRSTLIINDCEKALEIDPECVEAHCNMGWAFLNNGATIPANNCFQKALKLNPNLESAQRGLQGVAKTNYWYWLMGY